MVLPLMSFADVIKSAPSFTTLAGLLAGFVFATSVSVLYGTSADETTGLKRQRDYAIMWLIVSFFTLLFSAFSYNVISGMTVNPDINVIPHFCNSIAVLLLLMGILQLILGLSYFLTLHEVSSFVKNTIRFVFYLILPLLLFELHNGIGDIARIQAGSGNLATFGALLTENIPSFIVLGIVYGAGLLHLLFDFSRVLPKSWIFVIAYISLAFAFAAETVFSVVNVLPESAIRALDFQILNPYITTFFGILLVSYMLCLPRSVGKVQPKQASVAD